MKQTFRYRTKKKRLHRSGRQRGEVVLALALLASALVAGGAGRADAAETVDGNGWICSTEPAPTLPAATTAEGQRARTIESDVSRTAAGRTQIRFARPIDRNGMWIARADESVVALPACASATYPTVRGWVDPVAPVAGNEAGYVVYAAKMETTPVAVNWSRKPAAKGTLLLVIEEELWGQDRRNIEVSYLAPRQRRRAGTHRSSRWHRPTPRHRCAPA